MTEPKFCHNCGAPLPAGPRGRQPFSLPYSDLEADRDKEGDGGWDCNCNCPFCKWSGDIFPDDEAKA